MFFSAPRALPPSVDSQGLALIHKLQDSKPGWHVKCFPFGNGAPRKKLTVIVTALSCCSKEIHSPFSVRMYRANIHRRDRYAHFGRPNMILGVDACCMLKARIPRHIIERLFGLIDFEIHPLVIGGYLELIVVIHSLWLRVQKDFYHVAIPKLPSLNRGVLSFIDIQ